MSQPNEEPQTVAWGKKVSPEFRKKVIGIAERLGTKPDYLMAIMAFETGGTFDPAQPNRNSPVHGPKGLIQFTDVGAKSVGTTKEALVKMTALDQLDYVEKLLALKKGAGLSNLEDLYAAVHWPVAVGKGSEYVMYSASDKRTRRYFQANKGFDNAPRNNEVTLKEAAAKVWEKLAEGDTYRE